MLLFLTAKVSLARGDQDWEEEEEEEEEEENDDDDDDDDDG